MASYKEKLIPVRNPQLQRTLEAALGAAIYDIKGEVYYVDSNEGASTNGGKSWDNAKATVDQAINLCVANRGDIILIAPNHAETIDAATDLVLDVDGVYIIGLGEGTDRPTFTFSTDTAANIPVSGDNVYIQNILCLANIDSIVAGFTISGSDCTLKNIEWRDTTDIEAITAILTTAAADRLTIDGFIHSGFVTGDASDTVIALVGVDKALITNSRFIGNYATAIIEFVTTACNDIVIENCYFLETGTTDFSKNVVDTVTGSIWSVKGFDIAAGSSFSGGSGAAVAGDDISSVSTAVTAVQADIGDPSSRTNLQNIEDMLGNADTATASIYNAVTGIGVVANSHLGVKVTRAAADIFDGTQTALFTIATGKVLVTSISVEVTTAAIDAGASNTSLVTNPTVGTDAAMCAVLDINADEAGTIYSITGEPATALTGGSGGGANSMVSPFIVAEGTIDLLSAADVGTGGALGYCELWYIPLDAGATVVST